MAMRIMFPLLTEMGFQPEGKVWHYPIARDAAAFHINAFAVQSFIDRVLRRLSEAARTPAVNSQQLSSTCMAFGR